MNYPAISIQCGHKEEQDKRVPHQQNVFVQRHDCQYIKKKLYEIIDGEAHSKALIAFLHGKISKKKYDSEMQTILNSLTAKVIHNHLIRSILFNTHYSMQPPSNINMPPPRIPFHIQKHQRFNTLKPSELLFNSYTTSDLGHLPSLSQLSSRISVILSRNKLEGITTDDDAVKLINQQLKSFIVFLLKCSLVTCIYRAKSAIGEDDDQNDTDSENVFKIDVSVLMTVLQTEKMFCSSVSSDIISKYSRR